ncbi:MAG TPA: tetratricopeptide repeat protein [Xanthomonadaceae bacterium]|nr:tetratricopeptide repeat protein [Xanthomonadaceae bacterium]
MPALTTLGTIAWNCDFNWAAAEDYFRQALEAGPGHAEAHLAFSDFCCYQRRYDAAIDAACRALEIDPNSAWINALLAQALHMAGLHHEAITQARNALEIAPGFPFAHLFAGAAALMLHRHEEGILHLEQACAHSSRVDFVAGAGCAYGLAGKPDQARRILHQLQHGEAPVPAIALAMLHLGLGDHGRALDMLEQAYAQRDWHVLLLHAEPLFRPLRRHPRAIALLERLQLPD